MDDTKELPNAASPIRTVGNNPVPGDNSSVFAADEELYNDFLASKRADGLSRTYMRAEDETHKYYLPVDNLEADRLDLQHQLFKLTLDDKLFLSPIGEHVQEALDVGTGTGIWAVEFAEQYPNTRVIGTDLSSNKLASVPPNCSFLINDADLDWNYEQKFDLIHGRMLMLALKNWPRYFQQCYENLKPGGWVEMQDMRYPPTSDDGTLAQDGPMLTWSDGVFRAAQKAGHQLDSCRRYAKQMADAGFINIHETLYKWPLTPWPKDQKDKLIGVLSMRNFLKALQGLTMAFFKTQLGWSQEEIEACLVEVRKELMDPSKHGYVPICIVYGQKPEHTPAPGPSESPQGQQSHNVVTATDSLKTDSTNPNPFNETSVHETPVQEPPAEALPAAEAPAQ